MAAITMMGSAADVSGGAVSFLAFCYSSYCLSLSPILFTFASYCETLYRYFSIRFKIFDFPTLRPAYPTLRPMAAVLFHLFPALEIHCSIYLLSYFFPLSLSHSIDISFYCSIFTDILLKIILAIVMDVVIVWWELSPFQWTITDH